MGVTVGGVTHLTLENYSLKNRLVDLLVLYTIGCYFWGPWTPLTAYTCWVTGSIMLSTVFKGTPPSRVKWDIWLEWNEQDRDNGNSINQFKPQYTLVSFPGWKTRLNQWDREWGLVGEAASHSSHIVFLKEDNPKTYQTSYYNFTAQPIKQPHPLLS